MTTDEENLQVLNLVQALLGSITTNFRAVGIRVFDRRVVLFFVLESESRSDREEIDDIVFEFEALQLSNIEVEVVVVVESGPLANLDIPDRLVFRRKEPV